MLQDCFRCVGRALKAFSLSVTYRPGSQHGDDYMLWLCGYPLCATQNAPFGCVVFTAHWTDFVAHTHTFLRSVTEDHRSLTTLPLSLTDHSY